MIAKGLIYANLFRDGVRIIFPMMRPVQANGEVVFRWGIEQVQATIERYPGMVEYFRRRLTWDSRLQYATSEFSQGTRTQVGRSRWTETTATGWKWNYSELNMGNCSTTDFRDSLIEAKDNVIAYAEEMDSEYRSDDVPIWDYDPTLLIGGTAQDIGHTEFLAEYMNGMMQAGDVRSRNEIEAWDGSIVHDPATMVRYNPEDIRINPDESFDMDQV